MKWLFIVLVVATAGRSADSVTDGTTLIGATLTGKRRAYALGQYIRARYDELLSPQYNRSEIYIRSTDSTRTKMTVLTAMAAVYSSYSGSWSDEINWFPTPYTTVPAKYDFPVYQPTPGEDLVYLTVDGCDSLPCDYYTFKELVSQYALNEDTWRTECAFTDDLEIDESSLA